MPRNYRKMIGPMPDAVKVGVVGVCPAGSMRGLSAQFLEMSGEYLVQNGFIRLRNSDSGFRRGSLLRSDLRERSAKWAELANEFAKLGEQPAKLAQ